MFSSEVTYTVRESQQKTMASQGENIKNPKQSDMKTKHPIQGKEINQSCAKILNVKFMFYVVLHFT